MGGQTALNVAISMEKKGILKKNKVELIGAKAKAISRAEDRDLFRKSMKEINLDLPKSEIVKRHQERIDAGKGGVIFGLASFAEGIDLPGAYLTHVVIVKIPFAVPDDPLQAATSEWMESQGRNPFMELTLPAASVRLVQAAGRLIRKEDDVGVISILDKRIVSSRYGRLLLDALPPFKRQLN